MLDLLHFSLFYAISSAEGVRIHIAFPSRAAARFTTAPHVFLAYGGQRGFPNADVNKTARHLLPRSDPHHRGSFRATVMFARQCRRRKLPGFSLARFFVLMKVMVRIDFVGDGVLRCDGLAALFFIKRSTGNRAQRSILSSALVVVTVLDVAVDFKVPAGDRTNVVTQLVSYWACYCWQTGVKCLPDRLPCCHVVH